MEGRLLGGLVDKRMLDEFVRGQTLELLEGRLIENVECLLMVFDERKGRGAVMVADKGVVMVADVVARMVADTGVGMIPDIGVGMVADLMAEVAVLMKVAAAFLVAVDSGMTLTVAAGILGIVVEQEVYFGQFANVGWIPGGGAELTVGSKISCTASSRPSGALP